MNNKMKVITLNGLLAKCYDAEKGYKEAAEIVEAGHLKSLFHEFAQQRYDFGQQIKKMIRKIGGEVEKGGTLEAGAHRIWMELKAKISSNEESAILEEVKRGEELALDYYNKAIEDLDAPSEALDAVVNQRNQIRSTITRIENMMPAYQQS